MRRQLIFTPTAKHADRLAATGKTTAELLAMSDNDLLRFTTIGRRSLYTLRADHARDVTPAGAQ